MSILLYDEIWENYNQEKITIEPFNEAHLGPNSYDVRLDRTLKVYDFGSNNYLDPKQKNPTITLEIPEQGIILQPGILYLGNTMEIIGSDNYIPMYEGRSSMARLGIESHISAGFGDIGFISNWTLEITVVHPVKIYAGMRIGQVYFHQINEKFNVAENRYHGKYADQSGPQESMSYLDE